VAVQFLGDKGTRLRLTLERGARLDPDTVAVTLRRAVIDPRVVPPPRMAAPGIGYVRLAQFTPGAPKALSDAIRKARDLGARQLILDLRGNPGGSLAAFAEIAGFFLPENVELFHADGRTRAVRDTAFTHEKGRFATLPLVVLVDEGTASAAEILAGTLQDHDRAVVVGRRTFGKALMQSALPLPGGDVVWLTTGRIVLPSGRLIQRTYQDINRSQYRARAGTAASADSVREYRTS